MTTPNYKFLAILLLLPLLAIHTSAVSQTTCGTLNTANTVYDLQNNVNNETNCFIIGANNVTLDGHGYTVNYSYNSLGYAVNVTNRDNITVKNLNIIQTNSSFNGATAIFGSGMTNSTINNVTVNMSSAQAYGISLLVGSKSNNVTNNNITTRISNGIFVHGSSTDNIITNNFINVTGVGSGDYGISIQSSSHRNIVKYNNVSSSTGAAIYINTPSSDNNTISNNIFTVLGSNSGIYLYGSSQTNVTNNTILSSEGAIYLNGGSNFNLIQDNLIKDANSVGFILQSSSNNTISGGSIVASSLYEYELISAYQSNNFTNTNFTATRRIYFSDTTSWFNYNNQSNGNIWLKTNVSGAGTINRTLAIWSNTSMVWNDTFANATGTVTAGYNLTGLLPNATYAIYNTTLGVQTNLFNLTTDTNGALNFTSPLNSNNNTQMSIILTSANISSCQNLDAPNTIYNLTANVSSAGTCFTIKANNVTLDGQGYTINYSQSATGYAINNTLGYNFTTIKNLNIVQGNASVSSVYGIYASGMTNSSISNNTLNTYGTAILLSGGSLNNISQNSIITTSGFGINLYGSSSNIISANNITTSATDAHAVVVDGSSFNVFLNNNIRANGYAIGVYLSSHINTANSFINNTIYSASENAVRQTLSADNTFSGGSIRSGTAADYYIDYYGLNNFTNTNFTASRKIYFQATTAWFNYNNQTNGNIWLKTSVSAAGTINRTLATWSNASMKWNDTFANATGTVTAGYNLTGLLPNATYAIYNTTSAGQTNLFNLTTDTNGALNFTAPLNSNNNTQIKVQAASVCQSLTTANSVYTLVNNVNSSGTCFAIGANNITIDGAGYTLNYSQSNVGFAVNNSGGYGNITIKNLNIVQGSSNSNSYAVYGNGMGTSSVINNTITTFGSASYGIYLQTSPTNNLSNNTITTSGNYGYGIYLYTSSDSNTISNNTIITYADNGYGIYLQDSTTSNLTGNALNTTNAYALYVNPTVTAYFYNHTIDTTNKEQGKSIYYYFSNLSITIANLYDIGELYITNSTNVTIRNITVINNDGIILAMAIASSVLNSNITTSGNYSYGIYLYSSSINNLSNNTIATSGNYSYGVYLSSSQTNTLSNNTVSTSGNYAYGIYLFSSSNSNLLVNNSVTTSGAVNDSGIALNLVNNNNMVGGSISSSSNYAYYLQSAGITNNFTNTNFNLARRIYFFDTTSWFNYNNQSNGNIWLKTNVSGAGTINRTLAIWSNTSMVWNDTFANATGTVTAGYNLTGLLPNATYAIYNTTLGVQTNLFNLTTDTNGALNFTAPLNSNNNTQMSIVLTSANISSCQNLDAPNTIYNLTANVSSAGTCFTIIADNVTLDGAGYWVNYSQNVVGYGVNITGRSNVTVKNLNIVQGNASVTYAYAIIWYNSKNGSIINNTITTSGSGSFGAWITSSSTSNNISNNNIKTTGSNADALYINGGTGYANYNTISNNIINTTNSNAQGIDMYNGASFNNVFGNNITTSSSSSAGLYLSTGANSNNISNNIVFSGVYNGIVVSSSYNNSINGGSIIGYTADYYVNSAGAGNNFTNTNFTASRKIAFQNTASWFNYQNDSSNNLWLKTSVSAAGTINRTLATWSNASMKWNDTFANATGTVTAGYNLTGLLPNATYAIYNTTLGVQTNLFNLTTDTNGALNFTAPLNSNNNTQMSIVLTSANISSCQNLDAPNTIYNLTANVSSAGTCFTIIADNVTLDGAGYWVNYSQNVVGYGVNITGRSNVTVKNLNIVQGNSSVQSAYALYANGMTNSTITNNNITTSGINSWGVYLYLNSNQNMLSNNIIYLSNSGGSYAYAFYIQSSSNNNITGGSIQAALGGYDYSLRSAGTTNNFINTNFTSRKFYFYDTGSWFVYNNQTNGNIWLKTWATSNKYITRTLVNWSNTLMKWNETSSTAGTTATYNLTGLLPNTMYNVYNTSAGSMTNLYILQTDSNGALNFTVGLNGNTEVLVQAIPPYGLTSCQDLTISGGSYILTANVSSAGTCFTIIADNVTLDGAGYWVNYSQSVVGYGVNITGRSNVTVKNLNIVQGNSSLNADGVYLSGTNGSVILNNTITTSGSTSHAIGMYSSSNLNNITNNTVSSANGAVYVSSSNNNLISGNNMSSSGSGSSYGTFYLRSSSNNTIIGGAITAQNSYEYYIRAADTTNNFTYTGFASSKYIYFYDTSSWFNYNNETSGNIWLKTRQYGGGGYLRRSLVTWSSNTMKWNDTNSGGTFTAEYNLTGLFPSTTYAVYNTSAGSQSNPFNLTTDSNGALNFTVGLNGNTEVLVQAVAPYGLTSCQNLTIAGGSYILTANVSSAGTCFTIIADNVTLDGAGYWVNYSQNVVGYGVNITGRSNVTVKNLNIVQGNASANNAHSIYLSGTTGSNITSNTLTPTSNGGIGVYLYSNANSNTISNNTINTGYDTSANLYAYGIGLYSSGNSNISNNIIRTLGDHSYGIYLWISSDSNTLVNNTITTTQPYSNGIHLYNVNNNTMSGGSITVPNRHYYLENTGSTNNFTDNNFTAARKIGFSTSTSWFNYRNDTGNIWLKTNVSAGATLTRTLAVWSQSQMRWNDTNSTANITAGYNLTGLFANTNYSVYNTSAGSMTNLYVLQTDSNGALNFTVGLNGNTEITVVDNISPQISFVAPTDANNSYVSRNYEYVNVSASDGGNNITAFIDFNRSLVGWWRFNQEAGENSTFFRDWSSWGNNGTNGSDPFYTAGKFGSALQFDGADDYVTASPPINGLTAWSAEAWVNPTVGDNSENHLFTLGGGGTIQPWVKNSAFTFYCNGDLTQASITYGLWSHITLVENSSGNYLYINGILRSSGTATCPISSGTFYIGREYYTLNYNFNGSIDEVRIYNRALSPEEINASFNAGSYRLYHNFTNLSDGSYTYTAYAQDLAGNVNQTETRTLNVETVIPVIQFTALTASNNTFWNRSYIAVNVSVTEANEANITFYLFNSTSAMNSTTYSAGTRFINFTNLNSNLQYWYNVTVTNLAGNQNTTETRIITLDTINPASNFTSPTLANGTFISANSTEVNISVTELNLDTFKFSWKNVNYSFYDPSLVLAMNFNNNSAIGEGGNRTVDISKYNNSGTCYGVAGQVCNWTTSGRFGGAVQFDGVNDYVDAGNGASLDIIGNITVMVWINPTTSGNSIYRQIISKRVWPNTNYQIYLNNNSVNNSGFLSWYNDDTQQVSTYIPNIGVYTHVAVTVSGTSMIMYANGINVFNATIPTLKANSGILAIGRPGSNNQEYFSGNIDEVRIYNRSLNASEVLMHYQSEFQKYNSTNWRFYDNFTNITADGTYQYYGWVNDSAGNSNQTETKVVIRETQVPAIQFAVPTEANNTFFARSYIAMNVSVTEANEANITFYLFNSTNATLNSTTYAAGTRFINFTNLNEGTYYYNVTVRDLAGNSNSTETRTMALDGTSPVITSISTASSTVWYYQNSSNATNVLSYFNSLSGNGAGQVVTITVNFTDAHPGNLTGNATFMNSTLVNNSNVTTLSIAYTIGTNNQSSSTLLTLTDLAGNSATAVITWIQDHMTPLLNDTYAPQTSTAGGIVEINATIIDSLSGTNNSAELVEVYYANLTTYGLDLAATVNMTNQTGNKFNATWTISRNGTVILKFNATDKVSNPMSIYGDSIAVGFSPVSSDTNFTISTTGNSVVFNSTITTTILNITTNSGNVNKSISIARYRKDPASGNMTIAPAIFEYIYSTVNDTNSTTIRIYYTDSDLSTAGINPSQKVRLRLYYFNNNSQSWELVNNSVVNTDENYVQGNKTSLGLFAVAGDVTGPLITSSGPNGYINTRQNLTVTTNTSAYCKYDTTDRAFTNMSYNFSNSLQTSFSVNASSLYGEGLNIFYVRCANDGTGTNAMASSVVINFVLDTITPTIAVNSPVNNSIVSNSMVSVSFDVTDSGAGVNLSLVNATLNSTMLGLSCANIANGYRCTNTTNLTDGSYSLTVNATDKANNSATTTTYFRVDTAGPAAPVLTDPGNTTNSGLVTWNWTSVTDPSGIKYYEIQIDDESGFGAPLVMTATTTSTNYTTQFVSSRTYYGRVRAVDNASNLGNWSNIENITVTANVTTGIDVAAQPAALPEYTNVSYVLLNWTAIPGSDSDGIQKYGILRSTDGGTYLSIANTTNTTYNDTNVTEGVKYWYEIRTYDNANSYADSVAVWTTISAVAPSNLSISINKGDAYTKATAVTLNLSAANAYQCRYSNDNSSWSGWSDYATTTPWILTSGDGTKTVYYMCKNRGSILSNITSNTIILDTTAPVLTITYPTANSEVSGTITVTFTGGELNTQISIDGGTWISTTTSSTYVWDTTTVEDGVHNIQVRSNDSAGNLGYSNTVTVRVKNYAPLGILKTDKAYVKNNDTVYFTLQFYVSPYYGTYLNVLLNTGAIDSNGYIISLTDADNDGIYTGNYTISTGNTLADGAKTITATITPKVGSSFVKTTSVILDNAKPSTPIISSSFAANISVNRDNPQFNFTSTDSSGIKGYSYVLTATDELPDKASEGNSSNVSYGNLTSGIYYFRVRAEDNAGNWGDAGNYTINIDLLAYNLTEGYNLISIPVDTRNMTASEFLNKLDSEAKRLQITGWDTAKLQITRWDSGSQTYESSILGYTSNNFIIRNPEAYWIRVSKDLTFEFIGYDYGIANASLARGWNMISWMNTSTSNAQKVLDSIGSNAKTIAYYNTIMQDYLTYVTGMGGVKNFTVNNRFGYWIYLSGNVSSKWMPAKYMPQDPPGKPNNSITGYVYRDGTPVENATVILTHGADELSSRTENGVYLFTVDYPAGDMIEIAAMKDGFSGSSAARTNGEAYQSMPIISLRYPFYDSFEDLSSGTNKKISALNLTLDIMPRNDTQNVTLTIMSFPKPNDLPVKGVRKFRISTDKYLNASIVLTVNYADKEITGVNESTLSMYRLGNDWDKVNYDLNATANYISSDIQGSGYYALGGDAIISKFNITLHKGWNMVSLPFGV